MTKNKKPKSGKTNAYDVGFGKPPRESQFKKGYSGNPRGRPKKPSSDSMAAIEILTAPLTFKSGGRSHTMTPFEISTRKTLEKAMKNDPRAIRKFIKLCEEYDILTPPTQIEGGVIEAPEGVNFHEWLDSVTEVVLIDDV